MPAPYPPEKVEAWKDQICALIAEGKSVQTISAMEEMPSSAMIYRWLATDGDFVERYTRAREQQADKLAEEIVDIADTEPDPNKARIRVDARKWVAAKLKARVYGDRIQVDGDMNVRLSDDQLDNRIAQLIGKIGAGAAAGGAGTPEETA